MFIEYKEPYEKVLKNNGFNNALEYTEQNDDTINRKRRKKHVIYYKPPFSSTLKTNIGKELLKVVVKYFPKNGPFDKILNKYTI